MTFLLNSDKGAYIWGCGLLGRSLFAAINRRGLADKVAGFIDSNAKMQGTSFQEKIVYPPDVAGGSRVIVAAAKKTAPIFEQLARSGVEGCDIFDVSRCPELGHWSIELVNGCNLKCPSCPRGNYGNTMGKKIMPVELFSKIIKHISKIDEFVSYIAIYNWGDSLLYPYLPQILEILNDGKFYIAASSNLSMPKPDLDSVAKHLRCGELRVSVSGFSSDIYGRSHKGGNIDTVKRNMVKLREKLTEYNNNDIQVKVVYHIYKHNLHQVKLMEDFATELGFVFDPIKAILFPVEHLTDFVESGSSRSVEFNSMADNMLESVESVLQRGREEKLCKFWRQNNVDVDGAVTLCCISFDRNINTIADTILQIETTDELLRRKTVHPTCRKCMHYKINQFVWGDLWV